MPPIPAIEPADATGAAADHFNVLTQVDNDRPVVTPARTRPEPCQGQRQGR